jgi:hypothetical protein
VFDQAFTNAEADPCHGSAPYYATALVAGNPGKTLTLRYEAELAFDDGVYAECDFELHERRISRLRDPGWINVPCEATRFGPLSGTLSDRIARVRARLFE